MAVQITKFYWNALPRSQKKNVKGKRFVNVHKAGVLGVKWVEVDVKGLRKYKRR